MIASMKTAAYTPWRGRLAQSFISSTTLSVILETGLLRHRGAVDLGEMRRDLPRGQPLRIQRQDDLVDPGQPPLALLHDHRRKRPVAVPRHIDLQLARRLGQDRLRPGPVADVAGITILGGAVLRMAQVLRHLLVQRSLEHTLRELLQQPVRAGNRLVYITAYKTVRRLARKAGLPAAEQITPHSLRHTFVTEALAAGAPLQDVQDAAGHADPRTTRRYDRTRKNHDNHPTFKLVSHLRRDNTTEP